MDLRDILQLVWVFSKGQIEQFFAAKPGWAGSSSVVMAVVAANTQRGYIRAGTFAAAITAKGLTGFVEHFLNQVGPTQQLMGLAIPYDDRKTERRVSKRYDPDQVRLARVIGAFVSGQLMLEQARRHCPKERLAAFNQLVKDGAIRWASATDLAPIFKDYPHTTDEPTVEAA